MNKTYKIIGLDCAHCAQKLEGLINNIEGVINAKIVFVLQKLSLTLNAENIENTLSKVMDIVEEFGEGEISLKEI